ncbi:hypothetical protein COV24_03295 [candidate division WWE3 bacterium CG10_big_fil_rev_8_21_14_0_10_32_10]|uniref:Glycosyltransferase family 4 protein n=1 Tax=candidate division WWE3 bacterium CG10_big_fil_rev_8_21_14_0_10_32_10 TaxID=1975090 RepID=A0A2H0R9Y3_UNCKA|nr:MAG: hypothetical protein COV24_03295 [candidate division WWE3 bacterium CG10_big_fil_rev_8_21_14_0_10_32_10]
MKVGIITHSYLPNVDGVVRSIQIIQKYLEKRGHKVVIFAPEYENKSHYKDKKNVIRVSSLLNPKFSGFETPFPNFLSPTVLVKIKNENLDIIHVQNPFLVGEVSLLIGKFLNIPVILTYHTIYEMQAHYVKYFSKLIAELGKHWGKSFSERCNEVIVPSYRIKKKLIRLGAKGSFHVIPTGLDFELINKLKPLPHQKYGFTKKDRILISVGRLGFDKRILMLLDTLSPLLKNNKNIKYVICGDGPEKQTMENLIKRESLESQVKLTGNLPHKEIFKLLKMSDLFLIGSIDETQGVSLLEALSVGTPVIAIKEDWTKIWKTKAVVKVKIENLSDSIKKILNDIKKHKRLSITAKDYAKQFDEEILIDEVIKVYREAKGKTSRM